MCTYNGARFLKEQLESIAGQTYLPLELVICDDGSDDESVRILQEFAHRAPFPVRVHVNEKNLGLTQNFGLAIALCEGDIIALSDQDDVWIPEKISHLDAEFGRSEEIGLVFSDADLIDVRSRRTGKKLWETLGLEEEERAQLAKGRAIPELFSGSIVTGATMAFRRRFQGLILPIPDNLTVIHDGWIALLIIAVARISSVNLPLIQYRCHPGQRVGALARRQAFAGVSNALRRSNPYVETMAIARSVHQRLLDKGGGFDSGTALTELQRRIAHLQVRTDLPPARMQRVQAVLRELLTLRYHNYSNGFRSAAKDMFRV